MQFLELGRRARWKFQLSELILLAGRMAALGLIALALARPFWNPKESSAEAAAGTEDGGRGVFDGQRRDVVLVIDGSGSMGRKAGGDHAPSQAAGVGKAVYREAWARAIRSPCWSPRTECAA